MDEGRLTARAITEAYIARIDEIDRGPGGLRAVLELNPDALAIADALDSERAAGALRGPLHGIPILLKDNIDTADRLHTTAGSLALLGSRPHQDAEVARRLRAAGAIVLGKTNMSEWANFRSNRSSSGWSGRGRQTRNPYALDRNPCGSSSGSAAAVAASLCAAALGSETDGSIVCPSSLCGVVGIKPTVGLASRSGVIPISSTQDTVGPHGRTVADAAILLGAIAGADPRDPATAAGEGRVFSDYTQFLYADGLRGARIGVLRSGKVFGYHPDTDRIAEEAIRTMAAQGALIIDPVHTPEDVPISDPAEYEVMLYEFKATLNAYLAGCGGDAPRSLAELIAFNEANREQEMPYFGQEIFLLAEAKGDLGDPAYRDALARSRDNARNAINSLMEQHQLDAIVMPSESPAWLTDLINGDHFLGGSSALAARAGYPLVTVPAGDAHGLPVGVTFMGGAFSEPTLIRLAYAFEQAAHARRPPQLLPTLDLS
jgi:amidase